MEREYTFDTTKRVCTLTVQETADHVFARLTFDRGGLLGDENLIEQWVRDVLRRYEYDPRQLSLVGSDGRGRVAVETPAGIVAARIEPTVVH
jgi:hypothetical protein